MLSTAMQAAIFADILFKMLNHLACKLKHEGQKSNNINNEWKILTPAPLNSTRPKGWDQAYPLPKKENISE